MRCLSSKVIKSGLNVFLAIEGLHKEKLVMRHFARNGIDQCQNGTSNLLFISYREQPRSTRIVVAYPRPAFSATKRTQIRILEANPLGLLNRELRVSYATPNVRTQLRKCARTDAFRYMYVFSSTGLDYGTQQYARMWWEGPSRG